MLIVQELRRADDGQCEGNILTIEYNVLICHLDNEPAIRLKGTDMRDASIWPFDYLRGDYRVPSPEILIPGPDEPQNLDLDTELRFRCFILCAFEPADRAEALQKVVQTIADGVRAKLLKLGSAQQVGQNVDLTVKMFNNSGAIHSDIWRSIRDKDIIIADVSDENANVMYELGVAATIKALPQVIIVASDRHKDRIKFDLKPLRHLFYKETIVGDSEFVTKFSEALLAAVLSLPFARRPTRSSVTIPYHMDFRGSDSDDFLCPTGVHRRSNRDGLEFGGVSYAHSWLCFGNVSERDVVVQMRVRFLRSFPPKNNGYVAITLRSSHYFANYSRLFYVSQDGFSVRTVPDSNNQKGYFDERIDGANGFPAFSPGKEWFTITHGIDSEGELLGVNESFRFFAHGDVRDGYPSLAAGRIMVQTWMSLVQIESVDVQSPHDLRSKGTLPPMNTDRNREIGK